MKVKIFTRVFSIILLNLFSISNINAQLNNNAFKEIIIGINAVKDYNYGNFQHHWEPDIGAEGYIATQFYAGFIQTGIMYSGFKSYIDEAPDFTNLQFYLQWDYELILLSPVSFSLGGRIALTEMIFNENAIVTDKNLLNETEFTAGLVSRINVMLAEGWSINLNGRYLTVFTFPRMNSLYLGVGISKAFTAPGWLREFLK